MVQTWTTTEIFSGGSDRGGQKNPKKLKGALRKLLLNI
jgi:hypothetical protein